MLRACVFFYTIPIWLAISDHFLLLNEGLTKICTLLLVMTMLFVIWVFFASLLGLGKSLMVDHFTIAAAILWAGIALSARLTSISKERPETQLFIRLLVSAPILFVVTLFFGPFICNLTPVYPSGLAFQSFVVASFGLLFLFKLIANYKASALASFSFLAPALSVFLLSYS